MRARAVAILGALVLAGTARAGSALPPAMPDDAVITFTHEWADTPITDDRRHVTTLIVSRGSGWFTESFLDVAPADSTPFALKVAPADLDRLYADLRANELDRIELTGVAVTTDPNYDIEVRWSGGTVGFHGRRRVAPASLARFEKIVAAFETLQRRAIEVNAVVLQFVTDESLAGRQYTVTLDGNLVLHRSSAHYEGHSVARALRHVLPGGHVVEVSLDAPDAKSGHVSKKIALDVPRACGLEVSTKGDTIAWETSAVSNTVIEIRAADAQDHGLPRASIELDTGAVPLFGRPFPAAGTFLSLSGPPGGPLGLSLEACSGAAETADALEALARKRFADRSFVMKSTEKVILGGTSVLALTCATDTSHARSVHLLALFPGPAATTGVLLDFFTGAVAGGTPSPADLMTTFDRYGDLLRSLRVRFEPAPASIGVATMETDGTIVLQLRAEGGGAVGDALLRYPKAHPKDAAILKHLGGLEPGQTKPVSPFPDSD